ncbi:hypothetical protein CMV_006575 [Castanea mollissima]|uniref:Uncharacterized protein n=1 Tax=Castanea mollissima TaxID=60419 RepID=A0A8J4RJK1_9ROSI|nr:hypothetical protein CMV_006575 [Castanea mollissima]
MKMKKILNSMEAQHLNEGWLLRGASTSSKAEERKIGSTLISNEDTLSGLFKKSKEEYRAEIILNVVVEGLLAKLRSNVIEHHISLERGFKEGLIDLLILLTQIQLVLNDVEKRQIYLNRCTECEEVPTLGHLPNLRLLEIFGMWNVRSIGSEFYGYSEGSHRNTTTLFPALRMLKLLFMSSLEEWKGAKELTSAGEVLLVFPCLEELIIRGCNKLRDMPDSVHTCISLQKLVVQDCPKLRSLLCVPSITTLPSGVQCYTSSVEYMENGDCLPSTSSIHPSLQKLKLYGSVLFLDQIQYFTALKILWIQELGEMVALPEWLGNLSSLQELYIVDCKNLVHLSTKETMQRFTKLKTVMIYGCPKLNNQIDHNPFIQFPYSYPHCKDFED